MSKGAAALQTASRTPTDSATSKCSAQVSGFACKNRHINFLSCCLPPEELAQSCTNWPFQLFSQPLVFFTEDPLAHTLHAAAWISTPRLNNFLQLSEPRAGCPLAHPRQPQKQVVWERCSQQYLQKTSCKIGVMLPIHCVDAEQSCRRDLLQNAAEPPAVLQGCSWTLDQVCHYLDM